MNNYFELTDKRIAELKRKIPYWLNDARLQLSTFDELNVLLVKKVVGNQYEKINNRAVLTYFGIAKEKYKEAYDLAVSLGYKDGTYNPLWLGAITDWLLECDATTGYVFTNEVERKRDRLVENILGLSLVGKTMNSADVMKVFKRASKYISDQVIEYGDIITYKAMVKAYEDAGVKRVIWLTEYDDRVCDTCLSYSGLKFDIDRVPPKPHWGCRCWLLPIDREV